MDNSICNINDITFVGERIRILPKAYEKMFLYTKYVNGEISGFGKTKQIKDEFVVEDVLIFKQKCSSGGTTLNKEALSKFLVRLARKGKSSKEYNLWWHSHYDFGVFFSPIDEDAIAYLTKNHRWISICINQLGEMIGRADERGVKEDLPIVIQPRNNSKISSKYRKIIKSRVQFEKESKKQIFPIDKKIIIPEGGTSGLYSSDRNSKYESFKSFKGKSNRGWSFRELLSPYDY